MNHDGTARRGKSRMSKALPAPPPGDDDDFATSVSLALQLSEPKKPVIKPSPAPNRSLPAHPKANMPPPVSQMRIPRRPVGSKEKNEPVREPSTHSASSVYSDSTGISQRPSAQDVSSSAASASPVRKPETGFSPEEYKNELPLPIPPKDERRLAPSLKDIVNLTREDSESPAVSVSSSTGAELWPRDSVRSEGGFSITDLYLSTNNNGESTSDQESLGLPSPAPERVVPAAAVPSPATRLPALSPALAPSPAPSSPLPPVPTPAKSSLSQPTPPVTTSNLPSKTGRKPVPLRLNPADENEMGSKVSKVLKERGDRSRAESPPKPQKPLSQPSRESPVTRLPTPEYHHTDKIPTLEVPLTSPDSPETPPRDHSDPNLSSIAAAPPVTIVSNITITPATNTYTSTSTNTATSPSNNNTGLPNTLRAGLPTSPKPLRGLPGSPKPPNLLLETQPRSDQQTLNVVSSTPPVVKSPKPQKVYTPAPILTPETSPPLSSSAIGAPQTTGAPASIPSPLDLSTTPTSPTSPTSPRSSLPIPPIPDVFKLPLAAPGTVFPAPTLSVAQLDCFQHHKYMRPSRNDVCPVACAVCGSKEGEKRWMCNWCALRCCEGCVKALQEGKGGRGRDVRLLVGGQRA